MSLMRSIRESIKKQEFPNFVRNFMAAAYPDKQYPSWVIDALSAVNISL